MEQEEQRGAPAEAPLKGWRPIAGYFRCDVSTVRRWAAERQLPVYRAGRDSGRGVPVHAFVSELEAWLRSEKGQATLAEERFSPRAARAAGNVAGRRAFVLGGGVLAAAAAGGGVFRWVAGKDGAATGASAQHPVPQEAHALYLRGTWLWNRRTPEGIAGAIDALTQALRIHPGYAEAHAGLAMAYNLARQYSGMSGWEAYPKAEAHARRAVSLAPGLAFAQSVLAFVEFHWLWRVEAGLERFETARRLDPDNADNLIWYASSLLHVARSEEALGMLARAQELAPDNGTTHTMKALALLYGGRRAAAAAEIGELIRRNPGHPWNYAARGFIRLAGRDYAGYLEDYARLGERIGVARYGAVAEAGLAALAAGGAGAMARAMAAADEAFFARGEALAWDIAGHHAMVGKAEEAMPWLERSFERHEERLIGLRMNVAFGPIREDRRYRALLARIGLPAS